LAELEPMISALIKENRALQRQIDKLNKQPAATPLPTMERALRSMQRRVSGSLGGATTTAGRRSLRSTSTRARRKITDPDLLQRRRQALAKAREARAAKRAGA
jgi:hypothetical protein